MTGNRDFKPTPGSPPCAPTGDDAGNVLIISYLFPPTGGGGVQRALKMVQHLPRFGWTPHVLTVEPKDLALTSDPGLLKDLPGEAAVHRAPESPFLQKAFSRARSSTRPANRLGDPAPSGLRTHLRKAMKTLRDAYLVPDEQVIWLKRATAEGMRIIREHNIDALFSTSGPNTNHLVGLNLKKKTGIPWVADFRDPWVGNMHFSDLPERRRLREKRMEQRVVTSADHLTCVTRAFCEAFASRYLSESPPVSLIYNGFDASDYEDLSKAEPDDTFTLAYAGILYPGRSPESLLRAIGQLIDEGRIPRSEVRLIFAGIFDYPGNDHNQQLVEDLNLKDVVSTPGHLPHTDALSLMASASALMLVGDSAPGAGDYIPGKIYEYLALGKPIIGTQHRGEAQEILESTGRAYLAAPGDVATVRTHLQQLYENHKKGSLHLSPTEIPDRYHRGYQAGQLAHLLNLLSVQEDV